MSLQSETKSDLQVLLTVSVCNVDFSPPNASPKFAPPGHPMAGQNLRATPVVDQWQEQELWTVWPVEAKELFLPMSTWKERKKK